MKSYPVDYDFITSTRVCIYGNFLYDTTLYHDSTSFTVHQGDLGV